MLVYLIPLGISCLVATILLRMFADDLVGSAVFTVLMLLSLLWALYEFLAWRSMLRVVFCALSGMIVFSVLVLGSASHTVWAGSMLWVFAVVMAVLLVDQIVTFHVRWMLAEPRLTATERNEWHRQWNRRLHWRPYRTAISLVGINLAVALLLLAASSLLEVPRPLGMSLAVLSHALITAVVLIAWNRFALRKARDNYEKYFRKSGNPDLPATSETLLQALATWIRYDPHPLAPGILRIPILRWHGIDPLIRRGAIGFVFAFTAFAVVPLASYFPITLVAPNAWLSQSLPEDVTDKFVDERNVFERAPAVHQDVFTRLSPEEKARYAEALVAINNQAQVDQAESIARLRLRAHIDSQPEAWISVGLRGLASSDWQFFAWSFTASAILCVIVPGLLLGGVYYLVASPPLLLIYINECLLTKPAEPLRTHVNSGQPDGEKASEEHNRREDAFVLPEYRNRPRTQWDNYVERIQSSKNSTERNSLFLGFHSTSGYPILVPRDLLIEHAHILGDSGSGKTSLALSPMIAQLVRMIGRDKEEAVDNETSGKASSRPASIVVLDLKGDPALFHGARDEAARAGIDFQYVTHEIGLSTCVFNPLLQSHLAEQGPARRAEILLDALALSFGEGYGKSYFSRTNRRVLARLFNAHPGIQSFRELYPHTLNVESMGRRRGLSSRMADDAGELFAVIESLASFDILNYVPEQAEQFGQVAGGEDVKASMVDMNDVLERPQLVYYYLPTSLGGDTAKEIGKVALYSLISAASHRETRTGPGNRVYVFIDEFQEIAGENLQVVLRQARSKNIGCILANQTISDLVTDVDLRPIVQGNTRFKQYFSATDLHQQSSLIEASGETLDYVMSWSESIRAGQNGDTVTRTESMSEKVDSRITRNHVITASDHPMQSVVHIPRGMGFAQFDGFPFLMMGEYHITSEWYAYIRDSVGWPTGDPGTIRPSDQQMPDPEIAFGAPGKKSSQKATAANNDSPTEKSGTSPRPKTEPQTESRSAEQAADIEQQLNDALKKQADRKKKETQRGKSNDRKQQSKGNQHDKN